ncbi:hypothetical protein FRACYDRAFT_217880 [Fragilariopsis cylindrus CCMP1102]|uniref:Uncharacterized protein n=1 Tax=Fragilariopsis cylindrus CCMP1102 TaxID=635003 RepID=A0A1E7FDS8_9STRA|nr:hypothetical protein FRACYDRAFT_217880 [Fragilariopsis cylindrus CCMP1102]|eukprot:OEU16340.1 hypothetical protein FRACYDRAFT_217880 [Fragilariopsis cylindrus CCMP1102]
MQVEDKDYHNYPETNLKLDLELGLPEHANRDFLFEIMLIPMTKLVHLVEVEDDSPST